jgi:hypothetical protein
VSCLVVLVRAEEFWALGIVVLQPNDQEGLDAVACDDITRKEQEQRKQDHYSESSRNLSYIYISTFLPVLSPLLTPSSPHNLGDVSARRVGEKWIAPTSATGVLHALHHNNLP